MFSNISISLENSYLYILLYCILKRKLQLLCLSDKLKVFQVHGEISYFFHLLISYVSYFVVAPFSFCFLHIILLRILITKVKTKAN